VSRLTGNTAKLHRREAAKERRLACWADGCCHVGCCDGELREIEGPAKFLLKILS